MESVQVKCKYKTSFVIMSISSGGMPRSTHGDKYTVSVMKTVEDRGIINPEGCHKNI